MQDQDLAFYSAHYLRQLMLEKKISPLEVVHFFLSRIERFNPILHAFLNVTHEEALIAAKRAEELIMKGDVDYPLLGIPIAITDTFHMKGQPTTFGSLLYKDEVAGEDSLEVKALKDAGAVILGKTNISEFLFYPSSENRLGPPSRNPWNLNYSPGISSTAAAVSAGLVPIGIAADMQSGTRVPSGICGIFGLKPTRGRVPIIRSHLISISERNFYQKGPMTRHVVDAAVALDVLVRQGNTNSLVQPSIDYVKAIKQAVPPLRIGWSSNLGYIPIQPDVLKTFEKTITKLESLGHQLKEIHLNLDEGTLMHYRHILAADRLLPLLSLQKKNPDYFHLLADYTQAWMKVGERVTGMEYSVGLVHTEWIKDEVNRLLEHYDLIMTPVVCTSSLPLSNLSIDNLEQIANKDLIFWAFTVPFNMSGHPAASIPCGMNADGIPIGIQVVGKYFNEELILQFAASFEKEMNGTLSHPQLIDFNNPMN